MDKTSLALKNEKDLLAEIIVNDQDASLIVTSINPEYFIDEKNKNIFLAIKQLADSRSTINKQNILAILNQDKKLNFDDASDYIRQMITVADVINISESIDTLKLNYVQKMINSFGKSLSVASISPAGSVDKIQY
jgi:replicative DNA helicase